MEEMAEKRVKDSETEQSYLLMHRHINGYGRLFGGQLVAWIDELAGLVGRRHCGHEITTACIDNLNFKASCFSERHRRAGRKSDVCRTHLNGGARRHVFVEELRPAFGKCQPCLRGDGGHRRNGRALPVPGLILESPGSRKLSGEGGKTPL